MTLNSVSLRKFLGAVIVAAAAAVGLQFVAERVAGAALDSTGQWGALVDWPLMPIHIAMTPDGKVMSYGSTTTGAEGGHLDVDIWNPLLGTGPTSHSTIVNGTSTDLFCSFQVMDPIRDVVVTAGGDDSSPGTSDGSTGSTTYSTANGLQAQAPMINPRWYPTAITLPDGDLLVQGGSEDGLFGNGVLTPERFNVDTGWSELTGIDSTYAYGNDQTRWWYPRAWVAPQGDVFGISGSNMFKLDPDGTGSLTPVGTFPGDNIGASSTAVMYRPGKILQLGGGAFHNEDYSSLGSTAATIVDINSGLARLSPRLHQ